MQLLFHVPFITWRMINFEYFFYFISDILLTVRFSLVAKYQIALSLIFKSYIKLFVMFFPDVG